MYNMNAMIRYKTQKSLILSFGTKLCLMNKVIVVKVLVQNNQIKQNFIKQKGPGKKNARM